MYFIINVKEPGIIDEQNTSYLSTFTNVLYFEKSGESQDLVISAFNISDISFSDMEFSCTSSDFEIVSNGNKATVTALNDNAKAVLVVSHPLAENTLEVNLHCGQQYQFVNEDYCYISTDKDVLELYAGQNPIQLTAMLNHTERDDGQGIPKGFTFTSSDTDVVDVSYVAYSNYCYVEPKKNGTARITITHADSNFDKEVVVVVNHAPDSSSIPYLTTKTNVITIVQGEYATVSVELKNSLNIDSSKWKWSSADSRTADIVANNGSSSMISANKAGTTELTVRHDDCMYSLNIVVVVLDTTVVTSRPYIKSSDNIVTIKKGTSATITAQMIGGTSASDNNYFRFNGSDSAIILVNGASDTATIKGMNTGMAYVTITNNRYNDSYSKTVLVIVEDTQVDGVYIKASSSIVKMKPDQDDMVKITAELIGGQPIDGEKFIWWVDDPNLVAINSVASQCSIMPTGRSGTTKVHIKHEKSLKVCDILVMISDYDTFAFAQSSLNVSAEKLYFVPMQVPAIEGEYTVEYESSNENVCIVQGSNAVAWICGRDFGNASLTARMKDKEGVELASAEMLVSVVVPDVELPVISLGNSIMTVEAGTSQTMSAVISGQNVDESEKYNLKWSWIGEHKDGISILDESPDKTAYGADTYLTFHEAGEYVLTVMHEATGAFTSMYIIVEDKGEITIELNSNLETIYKDEGSITLTATLTNASEKDYKNIEWSAVKVGGQSIVAVSKGKGKTCTVTPKNVGQTTVIAKLPDGKMAKCVIIVKANAELSLDLGAIHVIPGYTEVVNYTTTPENASVNWLSQMSSSGNITDNVNYFSFEDDRVKRQLRITGHQDYPGGVAGTISGYIMGASAGMTNLKVYVEYDTQLSLLDMNGNHLTRLHNDNPDTANVQQFQIKYYPIDLDIDIIADGTILACSPHEANTLNHAADNTNPLFSIGDMSKKVIMEEGINKCLMTVSIIPHSEGTSDIQVKATLPNDTSGSYSKTENFMYTAYYKEYELEIDWDSYTPVGAFTRYENNVLYIGDGEEALFTIKIKNENAAGSIIKSQIRWVPDDMNNPSNKLHEMQLTDKSSIFKRDGSVTRLQKAQDIFGKGNNNTSVNTSAQEVATKNLVADQGVIYFTTEQLSSGQTLFKLSHNWDFYKDLPDDVVGSNWDTYKNNNNYKETFISDLKNKGVDAWMITKEMFTYVNQKIHYMTAHEGISSNLILTPSWENGYQEKEYDDGWTERNYGKLQYSKLTASSSTGAKKEMFFTIPRRTSYDDKTYDFTLDRDQRANFLYQTCIPYVMTTDELKNNKFFVTPDDKDNLKFEQSGGFLWGSNTDGKVFSKYISTKKLLHDYATPTVSKDSSLVGTNGKGVLKIAYQQGSSSEIKTYDLNVEIERRNCEAYTNGSWRKFTSSPGSTKWVLSEDLYDGTVGFVDPYFEIQGSVSSSYDNIQSNGTPLNYGFDKIKLLKIPYEVYPADTSFTVTAAMTNGKSLGFGILIGNNYLEKIVTSYSVTTHETVTTSNGRNIGKGYLYLYTLPTGYSGDMTIKVNDHALVSTINTSVNINGKVSKFFSSAFNLNYDASSSDNYLYTNFTGPTDISIESITFKDATTTEKASYYYCQNVTPEDQSSSEPQRYRLEIGWNSIERALENMERKDGIYYAGQVIIRYASHGLTGEEAIPVYINKYYYGSD